MGNKETPALGAARHGARRKRWVRLRRLREQWREPQTKESERGQATKKTSKSKALGEHERILDIDEVEMAWCWKCSDGDEGVSMMQSQSVVSGHRCFAANPSRGFARSSLYITWL